VSSLEWDGMREGGRGDKLVARAGMEFLQHMNRFSSKRHACMSVKSY
jgi:hypothetical protein